MTSKFKTFHALHKENNLFILPNAWNATIAKMLQECNYSAIGTSSAAVAASLGYPDGEVMPFAEYLLIIHRIVASVSLPVTVDMEMGYGKTKEEIYTNLQKLIEAGVVGINIEDSTITNGNRTLKEGKELSTIIEFIKNKLNTIGQSMFINARCDTYLLKVKDKESETTQRLKMYENAGADGIFLPLISDEQDITRAAGDTRLPLNVMSFSGLPDLEKLNQLGVKRVSMGPFLYHKTYNQAREFSKNVIEQNSLKPIL